jgi:hypothetical protein
MRRNSLQSPLVLPVPGLKSGERWVMADFHIHSTYSGGSLNPGQILRIAQTQFLDVIAISDHFETRGAEEGLKLIAADSHMPMLIISQEISLGDHFHFLIIHGLIRSWKDIPRNQYLVKFAEHRQQGGAIILAHPWTMPKSSWARGLFKEMVAQNLVDAVELLNASILQLGPDNLRYVQSFWEEWIVPNQLGIVGGSDFHYHHQGRYLGSGRTYLKARRPGTKGVIEALHGRRCVAGLFGNACFDLGWMGKGNTIIFGADPWNNQLKRLIGELRLEIAENRLLKSNLKQYLWRLMEGGNYQMVRELLARL